MGGGDTQSQQPDILFGMRVQTSIYGKVRALIWGTTRVGANLIWYGDFIATPKEIEGGK